MWKIPQREGEFQRETNRAGRIKVVHFLSFAPSSPIVPFAGSGGQVPDHDMPGTGAGGDVTALWRERNVYDRGSVPHGRPKRLSCGGVPEAGGTVATTGQEHLAIGADRDRRHGSRVWHREHDRLTGCRVEEFGHVIAAANQYLRPIGCVASVQQLIANLPLAQRFQRVAPEEDHAVGERHQHFPAGRVNGHRAQRHSGGHVLRGLGNLQLLECDRV